MWFGRTIGDSQWGGIRDRSPIGLIFGVAADANSVASKTLAIDRVMAGKRKKKVETVFLVCEETGDHNYTLRRKMGGEKLKLKKYSPRLRKHTLHTEKKK